MSGVLFVAKITTLLAMSIVHGCGRFGEEFTDYDFETTKSELEAALPIRFPKEIVDGRAGKRTLQMVDYIVKFSANPEHVDGFLNSFPEGYRRETYNPGQDARLRAYNRPEWFKAKISKGHEIIHHFIGGAQGTIEYIYIDTQNPDKCVVYISVILARKQANR